MIETNANGLSVISNDNVCNEWLAVVIWVKFNDVVIEKDSFLTYWGSAAGKK